MKSKFQIPKQEIIIKAYDTSIPDIGGLAVVNKCAIE